MATQLGIGVRVFIGWTPASKCIGVEGRLQTGTIRDGPEDLRRGDVVRQGGLVAAMSGGRFWHVRIDSGSWFLAHESMLSPIDDGDRDAEHVDEGIEVTA